MYAKINLTDGSVIQFPYMDPSLNRPDATITEDVVEVDTTTNKPSLSWDQISLISSVDKVGDSYVVSFTVGDRYKTSEDKLKGITDLKKMHTSDNEKDFVAKVKTLKSTYPEGEFESWPVQRTEALAYSADNTSSTPLLSAIATARGITTEEMVTRVLNNISTYDAEYGTLLGKYQKNKTVLASIDLSDDTTWDNIELLERL